MKRTHRAVILADWPALDAALWRWLEAHCGPPRWIIYRSAFTEGAGGSVTVYDANYERGRAFVLTCVYVADDPGAHLEAQTFGAEYGGMVADLLLTLRAVAAPAEPAKADAPKIGAPRLADLDDAQAAEKKAKLRLYLGHLHKDHLTLDFAAQRVGTARSTLERYRKQWPEIEAEVLTELSKRKKGEKSK